MFKIEFSTDNAAFCNDENAELVNDEMVRDAEVARILKHIASMIERGSHSAPVLDLNGNTVGSWVLA